MTSDARARKIIKTAGDLKTQLDFISGNYRGNAMFGEDLSSDGYEAARALRALRQLEQARLAADQLLDQVVNDARQSWCTWAEIGKSLGTTRQAAWQKWGEK